jgi:glycosyltransferase involved in cell wall biosynthesis
MKVLYFHQHFTTLDGAGGTRSYEFSKKLIARGHSVTIVCGFHNMSKMDLPYVKDRNYYRGIIEGIEVVALPIQYSSHYSIFKRLWVFLQYAIKSVFVAANERYDIIFATSTPLTAGIPGIVMKVLCRREKFVFEIRDLWPDLPRALGMRNPLLLGAMSVLEWISYYCADACIALAPGIADGIRLRSRPDMEIAMIPNGCDINIFQRTPNTTYRIPNVEDKDYVVGFIGAHGIANGLNAILDVAAELKKRGRSDIKIVFVGDGKLKDNLVERARIDALTNCVFMAPIPKREIPNITTRLDCGLMVLSNVPAFYYGTSPNKFFDYLSAGIPVLNNYPGWLADLIETNNCGIVVNPDDPVALANAICSLADNINLSRLMGRNSKKLSEKFNRSVLANYFVDFLERQIKLNEK